MPYTIRIIILFNNYIIYLLYLFMIYLIQFIITISKLISWVFDSLFSDCYIKKSI